MSKKKLEIGTLWGLDGDHISPKKWNSNCLQCLEVHVQASPIWMNMEVIKKYIFKCPLVGIWIPTVGNRPQIF